MIESIFGDDYSSFYEALYASKDYDSECNYVISMFDRDSTGGVTSVLDLGCGAGGHAVRLASRGYTVHGIDQSGAMLGLAERQATEHGVEGRCRFTLGDIRDFSLGGTFDAAIAMFAVMSYLPTDDDLLRALECARRHLRPGGLLFFDAWCGFGVVSEPPEARYRIIEMPPRRLIRLATPSIDYGEQRVDVHYQLLEVEGDRIVREGDEVHRMRFFFPHEVRLLLKRAGFRALSLHPFGRPDERLSNEWQFGCVATAS